jgi:hypothetical protein
MPDVTITAEQLDAYNKAMAFLNEAATSPKTRRQFETLAKALRPELETTADIADQVAKPYVEQLETYGKKIDDFLTAQAERDRVAEETAADRARDDSFARLRAAGYTDDGIDKITRLMVERRIPNPEDAAAVFERLHPPPPAEVGGTWEPAGWDIKSNAVEEASIKELFEDPDRWADRRVYSVLNEVRSGKTAA